MAEKIILWLEDRPKTVAKFEIYFNKMGFMAKMVPTVHQFLDFLEENVGKIRLILIDLMLYGVNSLETVGIKDSDTSAGYDAGWVVMERLLRPGGGETSYAHIPVAILSTRTATREDKERLENLTRGGEDIRYFEKFGLNSEGKSWEKEFEKFINLINERCR